jgi:hypothetical protein
VDTVHITVSDLPADWYSLDRGDLSLLPGERVDIPLALHPPRNADSLAGQYSFTATVTSREYEDSVSAEGSFDVLPFEAVSLSFVAMRSKGKFTVVAENKGNDVAHYDLEGRDDEQAFNYAFEVPSVELQPGQKATVGLRVAKKPQWFGPAMPLPFEVVGHSASGAEVTARGQLASNPPLQKFKMPALYMVAAVVLLATLATVLIVTDSGTKKASAEDPYAGVHLCDDANAKAKQDEKNAEASQSKPVTSATVVGPTDGGRPLFGEVDKNGAPFFAQNDPRWGAQEYARSTELPNGRDWCGTTIEQCGCAMTSVSVMLALYGLLGMPDGTPLSPQTLNDWFNGNARKTERGWVSRGYIYGDVIWSAANELSGEIARVNPNARTVRFVSTGSGSEDEIKAELKAGRPVILEVPGHWIAAVGLDGDTILINDPFYRDRKTLDVYAGKVRSSVHFEPSTDLSAVVITAPADVKFRITDKEGRVVATGTGTELSASNAINQIPGASVSTKKAWRDPTCIEKAPPSDAGTNQITLPGGKDDYKVEIIGTGDQPGAVDIHTYAKDGKSTISTIEGQEGTKAEVAYDPNADKPVINITNNGTPQATGTPQPGGGNGGGPNDEETPTPGPSVIPSPTATSTPFVEQRTAMTLPAEPGQTRVEVATNSGFELGDPIRFAPGLPNEEDNIIVGFGSFILATPLKFAHSPGEPIQRLQRPPGQGPGLPPGVTPPPATGPLEPPSDITLNCTTQYQANPKQATFICDATISGEYTTTRWSLNGKVVTDFSGASSFIYAFPTDSPASIALTVCNQTLCRSTTRSDRISFPGAGTTAAGAGGTGGTSGTNGVAPPPPAGQVAVTCGTEFPITPDGQVAQFNCQVNFSGDFTNISWSAPGGTPANKNGTSKEFTTTIKNSPGTPPSLKISATVCNFGVCRTSQPAEVGISKTITLIDSTPIDAVNQGHNLTLMARVQGTGKSVPQGGTVQFYADGQDNAHAIGGSATLLTTGSVAIAFTTVDTNALTTTAQGGAGLPHAFIAVYSGGTNAFGSQSGVFGDQDHPPRIITVLPPIPDACDSVNNDGDPDNNGVIDDAVTDGTCVFTTPRDLGGGTVLNTLSITGDSTVIQDGAANAVVVDPGDVLTVHGAAGRTDYCPGCIRQVYIGIGGYDPSPNLPTATRIGPVCSLNGFFPLAPDGPQFNINIQAPTTPGIYYIRATTTLDYFCVGPPVGPPENSVGRIIVRQAITTQLELWDDGALWPSAPTSNGGPPGPDPLANPSRHQVTGISEGQKVLLRAKVPAGAVGRVEFTTNPPNVLKVGGGLPSAQVCPEAGFFDMPAGTPDITCVPWEARVITDAVDAINQPFTVTARYVDPDPLIATDPLDVQAPFDTNTYNIRYAATPSSNNVSLKVLAPAAVTVTSPTTMPVQMGSDFTLTADVQSVTATLGLKGGGGTVQFKAGNNAFGPPVPVGADGKASITWRAGIDPGNAACLAPPFNFPLTYTGGCGGAPFDTKDDGNRSLYDDVFAEYITGGDSLLQNACSGSNGWQQPNCFETNINIDPATSSISIVGVSVPSPSPIGTSFTITAAVTAPLDPIPNGTITFPTITFFADVAQIDQVTLAQSDCVVGAGIYTCTKTSTVIATGTGVLDSAGTYALTARFSGTSRLDQATSSAQSFQLTKQLAGLVVTLPVTPIVGTSVSIRAELTGINTQALDNDGARLLFKHNGATLVGGTQDVDLSLAGGGVGAFFNVQNLDAGTYNITVEYTGNGFYDPVTSSVQVLVIDQFQPTLTVNNITAVAVGQDVTISASLECGGVACSGMRSHSGGSVSFYLNSVSTGTFLDDSAISPGGTAQITVHSGDAQTLTAAGTAYTVVAKFNGDATNGNLKVATDDTGKSVTLTKRNSSASIVAGSTAVKGANITLNATVAPASTPTSTVSVNCSNCLQFQVNTSPAGAPTWVDVSGKVSVSGGSATLSVATGSGAFPNIGSYSIRAVYDGNTNYNADTSNTGTATVTPPLPSVSVADATMPLNGSTTLTAIVTPPSGGVPTCSNCLQFKVGATLASASTFATVSVSETSPGSGVYEATATIRGGSTAFPTIAGSPYTVWAVYDPSGNTGAGGQADDVGGPASSLAATVTVTARTTSISVTGNTTGTFGVNSNFSVTVSPSGGAGTIHLFADGVEVASTAADTDGSTTVSWVPNSTGTKTMTVTYVSSDPTNYADDLTSNTHTITINPASVSVNIGAPSTVNVNATITISITVSPAAAGGSVQLYLGSSGTRTAVAGKTATIAADGTATITYTAPATPTTLLFSVLYTSGSSNYETNKFSGIQGVDVVVP